MGIIEELCNSELPIEWAICMCNSLRRLAVDTSSSNTHINMRNTLTIEPYIIQSTAPLCSLHGHSHTHTHIYIGANNKMKMNTKKISPSAQCTPIAIQ